MTKYENSNDFCSDIKSDTEDHFRSAYPLSESKDDTDKELQNLIDSDEEDEKPEVTLGNIFFQFVFFITGFPTCSVRNTINNRIT